jgi:hypothetical protein
MVADHAAGTLETIDLVRDGASYRLAERLGLAATTVQRRLLKVAALFAVTWVPLLLLTMSSGHALGIEVQIPFLADPEVHARFLIVLPLLELAEVVVGISLIAQMNHLREMGIVPEREKRGFDAARSEAKSLRSSAWAEGLILVFSYGMSVVLRLWMGFSEGGSSWERTGVVITPAGWWLMLISLPILYFFLLRWVWIFLVWARFLYRVSRLDLELTPTHPDRAAGLGFLGWGLAGFATILMAVATVFSAAFAQQILHHGQSLNSLKYHVIVFVVVALLVLHCPLLAFSGRLARCRFKGLLEFGTLAWRHDRAFDARWLRNPTAAAGERILGSADIQSLAAIGTCYEHIDRMRLVPFDTKAFAVLLLAAGLPMLPLVGTAVPLKEIFMKLGELLI